MVLTHEELLLLEALPIDAYLQRVIARFRSGEATDQEWREMAYAVLWVSEGDESATVETIDRAILRV